MAAPDRRPAEPARRWPRPRWHRLRSPSHGRAFVVKSLTPDRAALRVSSHPPNVKAGRLIRPSGGKPNPVRVRLRAPLSIQLAAEGAMQDGIGLSGGFGVAPGQAVRCALALGSASEADRSAVAPGTPAKIRNFDCSLCGLI